MKSNDNSLLNAAAGMVPAEKPKKENIMKLTNTLIDLAKKESHLPLLSKIHVTSGVASATDMDTVISQPTDLADGWYYGHAAAIGKNIEFPCGEELPFFANKGAEYSEFVLSEDDVQRLKFVMQAMSQEETRYYLNGVFFGDDMIVATDGHRCHYFKWDFEWKIQTGRMGTIIPSDAMNRIIQAYQELKETALYFTLYKDRWEFKIGVITMVGKSIDGTFPEVKKIIPTYPQENQTQFHPGEIHKIRPILKELSKCLGSHYQIHDITVEDGHFVKDFSKLDKNLPEIKVKSSMKMPVIFNFNTSYLAQMPKSRVFYNANVEPVLFEGLVNSLPVFGLLMPRRP